MGTAVALSVSEPCAAMSPSVARPVNEMLAEPVVLRLSPEAPMAEKVMEPLPVDVKDNPLLAADPATAIAPVADSTNVSVPVALALTLSDALPVVVRIRPLTVAEPLSVIEPLPTDG